MTNAHGSTGTHTDERVAQPIRDLHRRFAPEVGSWTFPTHEDVRARAEAGGDIAAVWSRVERKLAEPPSVSDLFEPPLISTYPWMASYDRPGYLAMLASQSSYALMNPTRRDQLLGAVGRVIDERLRGTVTKEYITVLAIARRRVAWSGDVSAVNTLGDAERKSLTRTPNRGHVEPRASESRYYRMSFEQSVPSRRALLVAAALLPLAGCDADDRSASGSSPTPGGRSANSPDSSQFAALERKHGARLGVYALATSTGAMVAYRADERFAFCSTFKTLAAAAVLHRNPLNYLDKRVTYTQADVNSISPITKDHITTGMTIRQLCDAAIRYSDGTAGNLLMRDIGGPAQLTAYLRGLGDTISRMDNYEPELNRDPPQDPRDTTTARAIAADYYKLVLGDALTADKRALLTDWLQRNTTGAQRIQAGLPKGWTVADKTGTGDYGRANDIAIVWPPTGAPLVVAIMSDRSGYNTPPKDSLIAEATTQIASDLT